LRSDIGVYLLVLILDLHFTSLVSKTQTTLELATYKKITKGCDSCTVIHDSAAKIFDSLVKDEDLGWWIEVFTAYPACIYYFGVFEDTKTAAAALSEFTEDLLRACLRKKALANYNL
jgi:Domain of unknown function (DUF1816)